MVEKVKRLLGREIRSLHEAAYLIGIFAVGSQILGFVRDRLLASMFGAGIELDIYYSAFRIPDFIFATVSSLVAGSVLIPAIVERSERGNKEVGVFIATIFKSFLILILIVCAIAWVAMPSFMNLLFPNLVAENGGQIITISRIILLSPILLGLSNLFGSVSQAYRKFTLYAAAPLLYNCAIIVAALVFYPKIGLEGLAWGVVMGAFLHVLIQLPSLPKDKIDIKDDQANQIESFKPHQAKGLGYFDRKALYTVGKVALPRTFALGASQLAMISCLALSATLGAGAVTVFTFAFNLQSVPLAIVGVSYSLAAFPVLAELFAKGEKDAFVKQVATAARHILFWAIPIAAIFVVVRAQIVRTVLGAGNFSWDDTRLTAACLALFAISVAGQCLVSLFTRAFYCSGKTKQALFINACSALVIVAIVAFNAVMPSGANESSFFAWLLRVGGVPGASVIGVAAAYSFGMLLNAIWLWLAFEKEYRGFSKSMWRSAVQSTLGALVLGLVAYLALQPLAVLFDTTTTFGIFFQGTFASLIGIIACVGILVYLENKEIKTVWKTLHIQISGVFKKVRPTVDQTASEQVLS